MVNISHSLIILLISLILSQPFPKKAVQRATIQTGVSFRERQEEFQQPKGRMRIPKTRNPYRNPKTHCHHVEFNGIWKLHKRPVRGNTHGCWYKSQVPSSRCFGRWFPVVSESRFPAVFGRSKEYSQGGPEKKIILEQTPGMEAETANC